MTRKYIHTIDPAGVRSQQLVKEHGHLWESDFDPISVLHSVPCYSLRTGHFIIWGAYEIAGQAWSSPDQMERLASLLPALGCRAELEREWEWK